MKLVTFFVLIFIVGITSINGQQKPEKDKTGKPSHVREKKVSDKPIPKVDITKFKPPVMKDSIRNNKPVPPKINIEKFKPPRLKDSIKNSSKHMA